MGNRLVGLVSKHREIGGEKLTRVASAQIMMADDAEKIGLVDRIGYIQDALDDIKKLGGLPENARVVVYRRSQYPDDNYYNPITINTGSKTFNLLELSMDKTLRLLPPGFYHLWYQNQGI